MDPQPARPTVRSYRQQRQMQATGAEEAASPTAPATAPASAPGADAAAPAGTTGGNRGGSVALQRDFDLVAGYGSRRNQSGTAPAAGQEMGMGIRNQYRQPRS